MTHYKTAQEFFSTYFMGKTGRFTQTMLLNFVVSEHISIETVRFINDVLSDTFNNENDDYALILLNGVWKIIKQSDIVIYKLDGNVFVIATSNERAKLNNIASKFIFDNMLQHNMSLTISFSNYGTIYGYVYFEPNDYTYDILFKDMIRLCMGNVNYRYCFHLKGK